MKIYSRIAAINVLSLTAMFALSSCCDNDGESNEPDDSSYVIVGGINWATMNLGATSVAESAGTAFGNFYAWGATDTWVSSMDWGTMTPTFKSGKIVGYDDSSAPYNSGFQKYSSTDSKTVLEASDDAATEILGGDWRMPTSAEFKALVNACGGATTPTATTDVPTNKGIYWYAGTGNTSYNVPGMFFCDGTYVLFFPAPGCIEWQEYLNVGVYAGYWSSNLNDDGTPERLYFGKSTVQPQNHGVRTRHHGDNIRPVYVGSGSPADIVAIGGIKWATMNLGATSVAGSAGTAFGNFYAWGATDTWVSKIDYTGVTWGKTLSPLFKSDKEDGYVDVNAPYNGSYTKYISSDKKTTLDVADDATHAIKGGNWRMPTSAEFKALVDACGGASTPKTTTTIPTSKGIYWYAGTGITGYNVTGMFFCDGTNQVFFPTPGCIEGVNYLNPSVFAGYWSSTLNADGTPERLYFGQTTVQPQNHGYRTRHHGDTVRPVLAE